MKSKKIKLSNRTFFIKISQEDYERVKKYSWYLKESRSGSWYVCASVRIGDKVRTIRLHRFIMDCPDDMTVDHLNGRTLDNRRKNLEIVTMEENIRRRWARVRAEAEGREYDPHTDDSDIPF